MFIIKKQMGFSSFSTMFAVFSLMVFSILCVRFIPVYYNHYIIKKTLIEIAHDKNNPLHPNDPVSFENLKKSLYKEFSVNYISDVDPEQIKLVEEEGVIKLKLKYDVRKPVIGNIDAVISFDDDIKV